MRSEHRTSLRERKHIETHETIFRAGLTLFRRHGYEGVSMQDIADYSGVSRATVFNYFPSKEHFLVLYHQEMTQTLLDAKRLEAKREQGLEAIYVLMRDFAKWAEADRGMARALVPRMFTSQVLLDQDLEDEADLAELIVQFVKHAKRSDQVSGELDPRVFVPLLIGALSSTTLDWVLGGAQGNLWPVLRPRIKYLLESAKGSK